MGKWGHNPYQWSYKPLSVELQTLLVTVGAHFEVTMVESLIFLVCHRAMETTELVPTHLNAQFPESFMIRFFNWTSHTGELT